MNGITHKKPRSIWRYKRDKKHKHFNQNPFHFISEIELPRSLALRSRIRFVSVPWTHTKTCNTVCFSTLNSHKDLQYCLFQCPELTQRPAIRFVSVPWTHTKTCNTVCFSTLNSHKDLQYFSTLNSHKDLQYFSTLNSHKDLQYFSTLNSHKDLQYFFLLKY